MLAHIHHSATVAALVLLGPCVSLAQRPAHDSVCVGRAPRDAGALLIEPLFAVIDTYRFTVSAYAARDFMPGQGQSPDGSPLMVNLTVIAADSANVPAGITVDSAWVVSDGRVWGSDAREEVARLHGADRISVMMRGGPKWGPNSPIDVVVRLHNAAGAASCLRAPRQFIGTLR